MSSQAQNWAWQQEYLNANQKMVLLCLCKHSSPDFECWPSVTRICNMTKLSQSTVKRSLRMLIDEKYILCSERYTENQRQTSNFYTINMADWDGLKPLKGTKIVQAQCDPVVAQGVHTDPPHVQSDPPGESTENPPGSPHRPTKISIGTNHKKNNTEGAGDAPSQSLSITKAELDEVFKFWTATTKKTGNVIFNNERKNMLKARFKEGYSIEDCKLAITGIMKHPHNIGKNDNGIVYTDFNLIFRNGGQLEKYRGYNDKAPAAASQSSYATTCAQCKRKSDELTGRPARCPECYSIYQRQSEIRAVAEFNKKSSVVEKTDQKVVSSGPPPELRDLMRKLGCKTAS